MPYKGRCDKAVEIFEEHFCETKMPNPKEGMAKVIANRSGSIMT